MQKLIFLSLLTVSISIQAQVGIGTTSPSEILDLESSNATKTALDINNTGGGDPKVNFQISGATTYSIGVDNSDGDKFKIGTSALETSTILTIHGALVGIATSSPSSTLTINGATEAYQDIYIRGTLNNSTNQLRLNNDNTDTYIDYHGGSIFFRDEGAATAVLTLDDATGYVGIGCNTPQYSLHVIGDIASSATVRTTNALVTGAITACSDFRYKKEITPLSNSLSNVLQLSGVTYLWKIDEFPAKKFSNNRQIGVIAQEVEKIYPELVFTDVDGYKSVDYSRFTPILLEAMKEQQKMIEEQRIELETQKRTLIKIQAQLDKLSATN
ncbi:MAG: tail fiber domain-containing protein [Flavobacteriales bacterium]